MKKLPAMQLIKTYKTKRKLNGKTRKVKVNVYKTLRGKRRESVRVLNPKNAPSKRTKRKTN